MYRFAGNSADLVGEAQNLAAIRLSHLLRQRSDVVTEEFALPFIAREILRLYREGENDPERLANRAIGCLREHVQKRESALRLAGHPTWTDKRHAEVSSEMKRRLRSLKIASDKCERAAEEATSLRESLELIRFLADLTELRHRIKRELALQSAATSSASLAVN